MTILYRFDGEVQLRFIKKKELPKRSLGDIKQICKIVFVDNEEFGVVDTVKRNGWLNTELIKDIETLDSTTIKEAHVIFLDIHGVGKKLGFSEEGRGLLKALKDKYPEKKVVAYSAQKEGIIDVFDKAMKKADERISKNADSYEFLHTLEVLATECLAFDRCIGRIKIIIREQTGITLSDEKIEQMLIQLQSKNDFSGSYVSKIFNITNVEALLNIINMVFFPK